MKITLKIIIHLYFLILITNINSIKINITNELTSSSPHYINNNLDNLDNPNIVKKHISINSKSIGNQEYNITLAVSSSKLMIKVDIFELPIISFQKVFSLEKLIQVNKYFRMFDAIEEVYKDLVVKFEDNIEVINYDTYAELITYVQSSIINNITFIIPNIQRDAEQKIEELFSKIMDLSNENIMFKKKLDECFEEISEIQKLKKFNVLLISDQANSLVYNLLKICPYINEIYVFANDFIVQRFNEGIMEKFKIIIFDLKDASFPIKFGDKNVRNYINKGGNIIFTHEKWMNGDIYQNYYFTSSIKIVDKEHPVFSSYYKLSSSNLQITETHNANKLIFENEYLKDVIIQLNNDISSEYLVIKKYEKGKIIYWNVGHKPTLTSDEEKLLVNLISYIYQDDNN